MTGAIQTDVPENAAATNEGQTPQTLHDRAYAEMLARRAEEKAVEEGDPAPPGEASPAGQPGEKPAIVFFDDAGNEIRVPASARYRAKIDGAEKDIDLENLVRGHQKGAAADKRLEDATRRMREAEAKATILEAQEKALTLKEVEFLERMKNAEDARAAGGISDTDYRSIAGGFLSALSEEKEDHAVEKLAGILENLAAGKQTAPAAVDESTLLQKVDQRIEQREKNRLAQQAEQDRVAANDWFRTNHSDIVNDPRLMGAAIAEVGIIAAERPTATQLEVAQEVGKRISEWAKTVKASGSAAPPAVPKVAGARAQAPQEQTKPPTRGDVLNAMRQARGQPVL